MESQSTKNIIKILLKRKNKKEQNRTEQNLTYRENYTILFYFKTQTFFYITQKVNKNNSIFFYYTAKKYTEIKYTDIKYTGFILNKNKNKNK